MKKIKRTLPATENAHQNKKQNNSIIVSCGIELKRKNGLLSVSSRLLAKRMEIDHKSVTNTINKHNELFKKHGDYVVFKIRDKSKSGREKEAFLTEDQAYFLLSLSRNTEKVVQLKSDLVRAFSKLRRKHELLIDRNANLEYQQNRAVGKIYRRDLTDEIKPFIKYAEAQGSKGSRFLYSNITNWINKACCIESITDADEIELANISTASDIAMRAINKGIRQAENYKEIKKAIKTNLGNFSSLIHGDAKNG